MLHLAWPVVCFTHQLIRRVGLVESLAMLLVWVFTSSYGKRIRLTGVMVTVYCSVVYQGYAIVPSRFRWTLIQLEPGATAFVDFDRAKTPSCSAVLLWEARTWGDLPFYVELLRELARTRFLSNHSVDLLSAMTLNSTNAKSEVVPVDSVPGHPLCNSTDVIFSERFALKDDEYLARHYYLLAGSLWTYTLKAHVMAPAQTLHMSWDDFMTWKRDPKLPGHAEPLGIRSDVQSDKHRRGGDIVSVEWPIEKEGRFVVLLLPAATTRVNNQTNTEGALGGIAHHIFRKAHCSRCNAANRTNYRPVGAIIAMPGKDQQSDHVLFSTSYFWGAGGLSSGRLKTSIQAWRCRSGFRFYEAWALLVGWPLGPHVLLVTLVASSLSLCLAAPQQKSSQGRRDATTIPDRRMAAKPMPAVHAKSNDPERNLHASLRGELPGGPQRGGTEKSAKSEDQARFPSQRVTDPSRSLLQLMLSTHERQYAAFEKVARSKRLIVFSRVPWPSLDLFKEQLRQINASGVHSAATKTAKIWACRWHPDKW